MYNILLGLACICFICTFCRGKVGRGCKLCENAFLGGEGDNCSVKDWQYLRACRPLDVRMGKVGRG